MRDGIDRLRAFRLMNGLDEAELESIAQIARLETYPAGSRLFEEGASSDRVFLLLEGRVVARVRLPDGGEGTFDEFAGGEELGFSAMMEPRQYFASAWVTDELRALVIDAADLHRLFEANHHLGHCVVRNAGEMISRRFGGPVGDRRETYAKNLRALEGAERVIWDNGDVQLTTEAVLLDAAEGSPDVVPLEIIYDVDVEDGRLVLRAVGGDVRSSPLDRPDELAALVRDELRRVRLPYRRAGE